MPSGVERLIEPFAGSAAVSLATAQRGLVQQIWLNDVNAPLMSLWEAILERPEWLAERYAWLWHAQQSRERRFYDLMRQRFNRSQRPYYLLYLLARCVKASVRYNRQGKFNQSPDNRRRGRHPQHMRADILEAARLLSQAQLSSMDYKRVLLQATEKDFVYLDPPYQGVSAKRDTRYFQQIDAQAFIRTLHVLNERAIPFIISHDGRTGERRFGAHLPAELGLERLEMCVGPSSQSTLLKRREATYESLYLSSALLARQTTPLRQLSLFEAVS